jgi:hypothetical protein
MQCEWVHIYSHLLSEGQDTCNCRWQQFICHICQRAAKWTLTIAYTDNLSSSSDINLTKRKNQLLPDNETEQKRNATGLTAIEQSNEIMTRDDNSYGPESAWDIHKLTCMDNTPTNGSFNDEHRHPWKLTTTQDYNKHMQYADLGDRMMKLYDTILDTELGAIPPPLRLDNSKQLLILPSCGMKITHRDLPSTCSHA